MSSPAIRIHSRDNVVIARTQLLGGTVIESEGITVSGLHSRNNATASA